jgi:hypothetical protein
MWAVEEIKARTQDDPWRFLYTPKTTLASSTKLVLFAKKPHLSARNPLPPKYRESREDGNAWRKEKWPSARVRQEQEKKHSQFSSDAPTAIITRKLAAFF